MATIDISMIRNMDGFKLLATGKDKSAFFAHRIYGNSPDESALPDYTTSIKDFQVMETFIWQHRIELGRAYVLRASSTIANRAYRAFSDTADSNEVALTFYYGLMNISLEDRVTALAESICRLLEEEDHRMDQD